METAPEIEQAAVAHVERFVRTVLGIAHDSSVAVPAMPSHLMRRLLRTEEINSDVRDQWGCWEFGYSESFRRGKLWEPEVDDWLTEVRAQIGASASRPLWPHGHRFVVCPSHDVDMVTRTWTPRQLLRSLRVALSAGGGGRARSEAVLRAVGRAVVYGTSDAPAAASTLERCVEIELARGVKGSYFFTVYPPGRLSSYDCVYTLNDSFTYRGQRRRVRDLIAELVDKGFDVGLHGSYFSALDATLLAAQREALGDATGSEVRTTRQHWLHWDPHITPAAQAAAGFSADTTLGFNRNIGFRAGTSFPFFLSAPHPFRALDVLEIPLVVQENAIFGASALELDESLAREIVQSVVNRVAAVAGVFTFLVHPHSLLDERVASLYAWLLDYALDQGAWVTSIAEVDSWWRQRSDTVAGGGLRPGSRGGATG
jgi:hypothetical protein